MKAKEFSKEDSQKFLDWLLDNKDYCLQCGTRAGMTDERSLKLYHDTIADFKRKLGGVENE